MGVMTYPVLIPPRLYDAALANGLDLTGYVKQQPIPLNPPMSTLRHAERNPIERMNRKQRRAHLRRMGYSWAQARELAKRMEREAAAEAEVATAASRLSPTQARQALGEWAARDGK